MSNNIALLSSHTSDVHSISLNGVNNLFIAPFYINFGSDSYRTDELNLDQFFDMINDADKENFPKTSVGSISEYQDVIHKIQDKGFTDVLYIHCATELSGIGNTIRLAAEEFEDLNFHFIDSRNISIGQAILILKAIDHIRDGTDVLELTNHLKTLAPEITVYYALDTLEFAVKGGRLSKPRFWLAKLFGFKPITFSGNGETGTIGKSRGIENVRSKIIELATESYSPDDTFRYILGHTGHSQLAEQYQVKLLESYPQAEGFIAEIGPGMASHFGPGCLSIVSCPI